PQTPHEVVSVGAASPPAPATDAAASTGGTVGTRHGACRTTASATLPSSMRETPVRPWVAITMRSIAFFLAYRTIWCAARPEVTAVTTGTPGPSSAATERSAAGA